MRCTTLAETTVLATLAFALACGPSVALTSASGSASEGDGSTGGDGSVSASGSTSPASSTTGVDDTSTTAVSTTGPSCAPWGESCEVLPCCDEALECVATTVRCLEPSDDSAFFDGNIDDDGGGLVFECDLFAQDCPEGEKCMPWANDGGGAWNATRCSPVAFDAGQPGEACTVEGSGVSGLDDCELAAMCWHVDSATNMGTCVALCGGDEADPICADATTSCAIANEGAIVLCLPTCQPLMQDCAPDEGCYPVVNGFFCAPNAADGLGDHGDACEYVNACNSGLLCIGADAHSACNSSSACCSSVCSLGAPDPDADCAALDPGQVCLPWYNPGRAPVGYEDVGICAVSSDALLPTDLVNLP